MSREIKFRGWDIILNSMVEIFTIQWDGDGLIIGGYFENKYGEESTFDTEVQKLELMQYTGLKDKNGKEIYEGDIVQRHSIVKEVKWFIGSSDCGWNIGQGYNSIGGRSTIEIVGNIYENPGFIKNIEP